MQHAAFELLMTRSLSVPPHPPYTGHGLYKKEYRAVQRLRRRLLSGSGLLMPLQAPHPPLTVNHHMGHIPPPPIVYLGPMWASIQLKLIMWADVTLKVEA